MPKWKLCRDTFYCCREPAMRCDAIRNHFFPSVVEKYDKFSFFSFSRFVRGVTVTSGTSAFVHSGCVYDSVSVLTSAFFDGKLNSHIRRTVKALLFHFKSNEIAFVVVVVSILSKFSAGFCFLTAVAVSFRFIFAGFAVSSMYLCERTIAYVILMSLSVSLVDFKCWQFSFVFRLSSSSSFFHSQKLVMYFIHQFTLNE